MMNASPNARLCALAATLALAAAPAARADVIGDKMLAAANGLVARQDPATNLWDSGFLSFNGTIMSGLMRTYTYTGITNYRTRSEAAATSMISFYASHADEVGVYLPEEVFALTQISAAQANPASNAFRTAAGTFFNTAVQARKGSTAAYIAAVSSQYGDASHSAIDLAYLTAAAYAIGSADRAQYRSALLASLANISTANFFQTAGLGAGLWALAQTGPLSGSLPVATAPASSPLSGALLSSLPATLDSRFDAATKLFNAALTGSTAGTTEDTAFALMGLEVAAPTTYSAHIQASMLVLAGAITSGTGETHYTPLDASSPVTDAYAGRALQALIPVPEPAPAALLALAGAGLALARRRRG
jgi:hypothetical protein